MLGNRPTAVAGQIPRYATTCLRVPPWLLQDYVDLPLPASEEVIAGVQAWVEEEEVRKADAEAAKVREGGREGGSREGGRAGTHTLVHQWGWASRMVELVLSMSSVVLLSCVAGTDTCST
jgi:hypothetical protein